MEAFDLYSKIHPYLNVESWEAKFPQLVAGMSIRTEHDRNYALHVGDDPQQVIANRQQLANALAFPFESWTCGEQVHNNHIKIVKHTDRGKGRYSRETAFADTDGLITLEADILLASFYADCVPLLFYSPDIDAIGVAHAGWQGTVSNIATKMVEKFLLLGADRDQLMVAIAPSIGACCYEVDDHVAQPLLKVFPKALVQGVLMEKKTGRYQLDLKRANRGLLLAADISEANILLSSRCTHCEEALFFSHRRQAQQSGRMVAFIGKKKEQT